MATQRVILHTWFDACADASKNKRLRLEMEPVLQAVSKAATKKNLQALMATPGVLPFSVDVDAILNGARWVKDTYRYRYSRNKDQVSATSELFSAIRQAITYHDND